MPADKESKGFLCRGNSMCKKHRGVEQYGVCVTKGMTGFGVVDIRRGMNGFGNQFMQSLECPAEEPGLEVRGNL